MLVEIEASEYEPCETGVVEVTDFKPSSASKKSRLVCVIYVLITSFLCCYRLMICYLIYIFTKLNNSLSVESHCHLA